MSLFSVGTKPVAVMETSQRTFKRFEWLSLAIGVATAALVSALSGTGYDLTDEGYYLSSIAKPAEFSVSSTQFGFVYHPLYLLVGANVVLLRVSSLAVTVLLGTWLTHIAIASRLPTSIAVGAISVLAINGWLISPNYNSLMIQSALLAAIGLALSFHNRKSIWPPALIGMAGWLAFMAKPPSAAALGVLTVTCLALGRDRNFRPIIIAIAVASLALLASATIIDGSLGAFAIRLTKAVEDGQILQGVGPVDGIFRFDGWPLQWKDEALLAAVSALVAIATGLIGSGQWQKHKSALSIVAGGGLLAAVAMIMLNIQIVPDVLARQVVWRILPFAAATGSVVGAAFPKWGNITATMRRDDWAMVIFLGSLPFVTALGSNVNYWIVGGCASVCWTLAGLRFVVAVSDRTAALPAIFVAQLNCLLLVISWGAHPYRQSQTLFEQLSIVPIGSGELRMSKDGATYVENILVHASRNGFRRGDPLLDLTGHAPGVAFALGALPVADPWILGGYAGSQQFANRVMARTSCATIARAWVLVEPGGPRALDPSGLGISLSNFRIVARMIGPATDYPAGGVQFLMRPGGRTADRVAECQRNRRD